MSRVEALVLTDGRVTIANGSDGDSDGNGGVHDSGHFGLIVSIIRG